MYARQHALSHPDKAAIIMDRPATSSLTPHTRRGATRRAAPRAAGLQRGDHIAVYMENSARMLEIEGAAERTGLYFTLINTYLAPDEVAYILTNSKSRMLFSSAARFRSLRPPQQSARSLSGC